jgi:hypothetical protein
MIMRTQPLFDLPAADRARCPTGHQDPSQTKGGFARWYRLRAAAYSLVEVLVAGGILAIGIAGAGVLAHTLLLQEESNGFALRAINAQEQAARLWQLGLSPSTITNILPERCSSNSPYPGAYAMYLTFTAATTNLGSGVTVEILSPLRVVYHSGVDKNNTLLYRTNDVVVVRPQVR